MSQRPVEREVRFDGPAGRIEGMLAAPAAGPPARLAVVCHPHPLHEGTMHNKVVHTLARVFVGAGFAVLRFNFRGVGGSEGAYDDAIGETDDTLAAVDHLTGLYGALPVWMAGFSFGSHVALRAAFERPFEGLVMVAPPVRYFELGTAPPADTRWLVVQGDADEITAVDDVVGWAKAAHPGPELVVCPDTDHFFHGRLTLLRDTVAAFVGGQ